MITKKISCQCYTSCIIKIDHLTNPFWLDPFKFGYFSRIIPLYFRFSNFDCLATDDLDFSGLSLHQAKQLEMDSQVRVLELEAGLEKERLKLAALRRYHYQLSGDIEQN